MRNWLIVVGCALAAVIAVVTQRAGDAPASPSAALESPAPSAEPAPAPAPPNRVPARGRDAFVGSATCAPCHRAQSEAYFASHHANALTTPTPELVAARFDGGRFTTKQGGTTTFTRRASEPVVTTPGPNTKSETLPVAYVAGVWPLQQFVVATERGKLQTLGVAWDARTPAEGGARWFHVYGPNGIAPQDPLFFTSAAQNWNHMCADCHSTLVERRYDPAADRFDTRWAELAVGCEACHGPGAEHVRTAEAGGPPAPFPARLTPSDPWSPSATGNPIPRQRDRIEIEICAPCHSRREPLREGFIASDPFLDSFEPELLLPGRYHADGQVEGEVFEWASFLQSRMYQAGVRCSDCHDAHSGKLHAPGNALCAKCHDPARFDTPAHSHHTGAAAPQCVDCHMPAATFMQIHERRDHSIRIPRPDHSVTFGTPNACNTCHTDRPATWARDSLAEWFPASAARPHFVDALAKDRQGALDAPRALRRVAKDVTVPAIARATALERLGHHPGEKTTQTLQTALTNPDPLIVLGAVQGASRLPPRQRIALLSPALTHDRRAVRVAAAKALAGVPISELPPNTRTALERAFLEVEQSFDVNASRAETHVERSAFQLARGQLAQAEQSLQTALRLQPCLPEAHLNLADLWRQRGDEPRARQAIHDALACDPRNAAAHHALGLWQIRARQATAALTSLKKAVDLAPTDPRFSYVLAVALAGSGDRAAAIGVLDAALENRPNDVTALQALATYLTEAGQRDRAAETRRKLEVVLGD